MAASDEEFRRQVEQILSDATDSGITGRGWVPGTYSLPGHVATAGSIIYSIPGVSLGGTTLGGFPVYEHEYNIGSGALLSEVGSTPGWTRETITRPDGTRVVVTTGPDGIPSYEDEHVDDTIPTQFEWPTDWENPEPGEQEKPPPGDDDVNVINPPILPTGDDMAVDWGDIARGVIDIFDPQPGATFAGPTPTFGTASPGVQPGRVTVDTRTGKVTPCRRRRRRRLLTPTDLSDLAALQAIVGKGDALKLAVAKAVRR